MTKPAKKFFDRSGILFGEVALYVDCFGAMQVLSTMFSHLANFTALSFPYRMAYRAASKIVWSDQSYIPGDMVRVRARGRMEMHSTITRYHLTQKCSEFILE